MGEHYDPDLAEGEVVHEGFFRPIQEQLSDYVSPNFRLTQLNPTTVQVVAGTAGDEQVTITISDPADDTNARYRYVNATVSAAIPGGAGTRDIYVTATENDFTGPPEAPDQTDYAFALTIRTQGSPPATDLYRKVGEVDVVDGAITALRQVVAVTTRAMIEDGAVDATKLATGAVTAEKADPYAVWSTGDSKESLTEEASHGRWLICDIERELTQAEIEDEVPDLTTGDAAALVAKLVVGANSMYGAAQPGKVKIPGYAGKVALHPSPSHPKKGAGSSGGSERVTLAAAESGLPSHTHVVNSATTGITASHAHTHGGYTDNPGNHSHTGYTDNPGNHSHPIPADGDHYHDSGVAGYPGGGGLPTQRRLQSVWNFEGIGADVYAIYTSTNGNHDHGGTSGGGSHSHSVQTYGDGSHTHVIATNSISPSATVSVTDNGHSHSATDVKAVGGGAYGSQAASQSHENMQPYRVGPVRFMYV